MDKVKKGRGRPRLDNALTPAERARRYREKQRNKRDVTENQDRLLADMTSALQVALDYALQGQKLPKHIVQGLFRLLTRQSNDQ